MMTSKPRRPLRERLAAARRRLADRRRGLARRALLQRRLLPDYLELAGFGLVTYAVYSVQHAAGLLVGGAILVLIGNTGGR